MYIYKVLTQRSDRSLQLCGQACPVDREGAYTTYIEHI